MAPTEMLGTPEGLDNASTCQQGWKPKLPWKKFNWKEWSAEHSFSNSSSVAQWEQSAEVASAEGNPSETESTVSTQDEELRRDSSRPVQEASKIGEESPRDSSRPIQEASKIDTKSRRDASRSVQEASKATPILDRTALSSKAKPFQSRIDDACVQSGGAWLGSAAMYSWYTSDWLPEVNTLPAFGLAHFDFDSQGLHTGMEPPGLEQQCLTMPPGLVIGPPPGFEDVDVDDVPETPQVLPERIDIDSQTSDDKVKAHEAGTCVPCAYLTKADGCRQGDACSHCHLCPQGELRRRKKQKKKMLRAAEAAQAAANIVSSAAEIVSFAA